MIKALILGLIGALVGGAVWTGITYATGYEIGYVAWGIGFLVGMCVKIGAAENEGAAYGALALLLSVLAILGAKWMVADLLVKKHFAEFMKTAQISDQELTYEYVDVVLDEMEKEKQEIKWPGEFTRENAELPEHFPAGVWDKAAEKFKALSDSEKQVKRIEREKFNKTLVETLVESSRNEAFKNSFGVVDIIFFVLAAYTAYSIGAGGKSEEAA
jgi:hypothetical protein